MDTMQDWNTYTSALYGRVGEFAKLSPDVMRGLNVVESSANKTGQLGEKVHELISLAVSVTTRCDGCIATHARKAVEAGATKEEIAEALGVAISLNAGAAVTYTARAFDAIASLTAK